MSLDQIIKTTELQRLADLSIRSLRQSPNKATLGLSPTKTRNFLLFSNNLVCSRLNNVKCAYSAQPIGNADKRFCQKSIPAYAQPQKWSIRLLTISELILLYGRSLNQHAQSSGRFNHAVRPSANWRRNTDSPDRFSITNSG